jgi:hypothetical protein
MADNFPECCCEQMRLMQAWCDATKSYANSVHELADQVGLGLHLKTNALRRNCRAAWQELEQARLALYRHEADHQCDRDFKPFPAASGAS